MIAFLRNLIRGVAILLLPASIVFSDVAPVERLPSDSAVRAATAMVKDTFKDDYKNVTAKGKKDLESKLIAQAFDSKNNDVIQYALLLETGKVAASIGDVHIAARVSHELENRYPRTTISERFEILEGVARTATASADFPELVANYLSLTDTAVWAGEFTIAAQAADRARTAARRIKTAEVVEKANSRYELAHELMIVQQQIKKGADPVAVPGFAAMKCIVGGDWKVGLPLLARGPDAQLAILANKDLKTPSTTDEQVDLADGYVEFYNAKGHSPLDKFAALVRSRYWYEQALPGVGGLLKAHVQKQLDASKGSVIADAHDPGIAELKRALLSSTWGWHEPDVQMTFTEDGHVSHRGMHGTYEILGPRRVILHTTDTPSDYIFVFNDELTHYTAVDRGWGGDRIQK